MGMSQGKLPLITDTVGGMMYLTGKYFVLLHIRDSCGNRHTVLTAHLQDVACLKYVLRNSYPRYLLVAIR